MQWVVWVFNTAWRTYGLLGQGAYWAYRHDALYLVIVAVLAPFLVVGLMMALSVLMIGMGPISVGMLVAEGMAQDTTGERLLAASAGIGAALAFTVVAVVTILVMAFIEDMLVPRVLPGEFISHIQIAFLTEIATVAMVSYVLYGGG